MTATAQLVFWNVQAAVPVALAALVAWGLGFVAIDYARRRSLLDEPGQRRSHTVPTPRGGGIGIVVAVLVFALLPAAALSIDAAGAALAFALVAAIGWIDDHRALPASGRLAVHLVAGAVATVPLVVGALAQQPVVALVGAVLLAVLLAWWVNLHNFMDGIDGLLAMQAAFVLVGLMLFARRSGDVALAQTCAVGAAAVLGFLPLNAPRARIFLGDIGSGALGFLVGWASIVAVRELALDVGGVLLLGAPFLVDSGLTLASRVLAGKRWWTAHREHLYQWLVRTGLTHMQVVGLYLAFNLGVVVPALVLRETSAAKSGLLYSTGWPALVFAIAIGLWIYGKRACLARARVSAGT